MPTSFHLCVVASLVESLRWTVVAPLPAIMGFDGLVWNATGALEEAARALIEFIAATYARTLTSSKCKSRQGLQVIVTDGT